MKMEEADPPIAEPPLVSGDLAASEGRWVDAIENWEDALAASPVLAPKIEARINWFLSRTTPDEKTISPARNNLYLMVLSVAAAIAATAILLIPEAPGSISANLFAVGAWSLIIASAAVAIVATHRIGNPGEPDQNHSTSSIDNARQIARSIGRGIERQSRP